MYPFITIADIQIHFFGIFLAAAWILFFICLHIFAQKKNITKSIFEDIVPFTISMFVWARFFFILSQWRNEKFIFQEFITGQTSFLDFLKTIFITDNYNLSLAGGIFGFFLIFWYKTKKQKSPRRKYLDIIMPAFLIAGIVAYFGAFLGGQVFGVPYDGIFGIEYNTKHRTVPISGPLFPLAFYFMLGNAILLALGWKFSKKILPDGYLWCVLLAGFSLLLFVGEFWNDRPDIFEIFIRLNQMVAIVGIIFAFLWLIKILRSHS